MPDTQQSIDVSYYFPTVTSTKNDLRASFFFFLKKVPMQNNEQLPEKKSEKLRKVKLVILPC